ncbi:MAG TPA: isocitrate lyase/phosphoenolpyruvate mutase family protein [Solirubrobacteraceae bacterium]|nr:isocitrate lyase/phosphoenolpyruvate mutase family protein [Solirubrobacteraceae bacterium]
MDQREKGERFRALHEGDPFVLPNPWDVGAARVLQSLGFPALATTSSGFAWTLGRRDGEAGLGEVVEHVREVADATEVPLSVDLEHGHGPRPEDTARAIERVAEAGAAGGSIEDWDPAGKRIYDLEEATERVACAVEAARGVGFPFTLTARAENLLHGNDDLDDTIARLQAYERAGADVVYAPGLRSADQVRAVCDAVNKPVNVLAHTGLHRDEIFAAGAQRISVGGALAWAAYGALHDAAVRIRDDGDFSMLRGPRMDEWLG